MEVVLWNRWHGPTLIGSFGLSLWVSLSWQLSGDPNVSGDQLSALTNITNPFFLEMRALKYSTLDEISSKTGTLFSQSHSVWWRTCTKLPRPWRYMQFVVLSLHYTRRNKTKVSSCFFLQVILSKYTLKCPTKALLLSSDFHKPLKIWRKIWPRTT